MTLTSSQGYAWYEKEKDQLVFNERYCDNAGRPAFAETYEKHPEYYEILLALLVAEAALSEKP